MLENKMHMLTNVMVVNEINEKGVVLKYKNRTYFLDKYDTHKRTLCVGDLVPVIIIIEKDKYGFVTTAKSIVDIGNEVLALPNPNMSEVSDTILNHSGYYYTISNILDRNKDSLYMSSGMVGSVYNKFLSDLDRTNKDNPMYTYDDIYYIMQLIQVISIEYTEMFKITDLEY